MERVKRMNGGGVYRLVTSVGSLLLSPCIFVLVLTLKSLDPTLLLTYWPASSGTEARQSASWATSLAHSIPQSVTLRLRDRTHTSLPDTFQTSATPKNHNFLHLHKLHFAVSAGQRRNKLTTTKFTRTRLAILSNQVRHKFKIKVAIL